MLWPFYLSRGQIGNLEIERAKEKERREIEEEIWSHGHKMERDLKTQIKRKFI